MGGWTSKRVNKAGMGTKRSNEADEEVDLGRQNVPPVWGRPSKKMKLNEFEIPAGSDTDRDSDSPENGSAVVKKENNNGTAMDSDSLENVETDDDDKAMDSDSESIEDCEAFEDLDGVVEEVDALLEVEESKIKRQDHAFQVLSSEAVFHSMLDKINEVSTITNLPPTTVRMLMNHVNWDERTLMEAYYDENKKLSLFENACVINPDVTTIEDRKPLAHSSCKEQNNSMECVLCFDNMELSEMFRLECGHRFCIPCWKTYLRTKIMDEGVGQTISCAQCEILVDDSAVMTMLEDEGDKTVKAKYQQLITSGFVNSNKLMRWCPTPGCQKVISVLANDCQPVTCSCKLTFCFACAEKWHDPIQCDMLKKWLKKCADDSETAHWISANTKNCPKCQVTIEKNGGCNHMSCRNTSCKHHFCWICLGDWAKHQDYYNCNRFDDSDSKNARDQQEKARTSLKRYLFYFDRYRTHESNLKFDTQLYSKAESKMEQLQNLGMSWSEVQFLRAAVDKLCRCREILMYSYVFAYYLQKTNETEIFETNQADLQKATEELCEYLERDITTALLSDIQAEVQDKYRYCESRREKLVDHVHEGFENDTWKFAFEMNTN